MERIFSSNYLIGSIGELIAQKELHLRKLHLVTIKMMLDLVRQGKIRKQDYRLLSDYDHVVDLFSLKEVDNNAVLELYEIKTLVAGEVNTRQRKLHLGWKTAKLYQDARMIGVPMHFALVRLYPGWKYEIDVKQFTLDDFRIDPQRMSTGSAGYASAAAPCQDTL